MFAYAKSSAGNSATFSFSGGTPTFNSIGAGSADYNDIDSEFGRWLNGGASDSTGTITVTVANTINNQAWVHVVELCGNDPSNPIAQNAYATSPGTTTPARTQPACRYHRCKAPTSTYTSSALTRTSPTRFRSARRRPQISATITQEEARRRRTLEIRCRRRPSSFAKARAQVAITTGGRSRSKSRVPNFRRASSALKTTKGRPQAGPFSSLRHGTLKGCPGCLEVPS